jgi:hypothetical protein
MWEERTQRPNNGMQRTRTQRTSHPQRSVRAADAQPSAVCKRHVTRAEINAA